MKILVCTPYHYYNDPETVDPMFLNFTAVPRQMDHEVHFLDHVWHAKTSKEMFNDFFLSIVQNGHYDLVFIQTVLDEFLPTVLDECKRHTCLVAWNSDDDWRWKDYSSQLYPHFSNMVTTYRHIYEQNKVDHPNLLLNQWACGGFYDGINQPKDIDFSFVGLNYGQRAKNIAYINKRVPILSFGRGTPARQLPLKKHIKTAVAKIFRIPFEYNTLVGPDDVNKIWNRSKISYTPLEASKGGGLQIKGRIFEMGLSGTVMLCNKNPDLYEFYEPGKEYVEFENLDDCVAKAKFLLNHENERQKIASAYYRRTKKEHLWRYRFEKLFHELGL